MSTPEQDVLDIKISILERRPGDNFPPFHQMKKQSSRNLLGKNYAVVVV